MNEEMAHIISDSIREWNIKLPPIPSPFFVADALQMAGYRKQNVGEWIDKPTGAYGRMQSWCSACGKHSGIGGIESNRHKPYCPNCGAKMKGGE
jgi:hypothetical protein